MGKIQDFCFIIHIPGNLLRLKYQIDKYILVFYHIFTIYIVDCTIFIGVKLLCVSLDSSSFIIIDMKSLLSVFNIMSLKV